MTHGRATEVGVAVRPLQARGGGQAEGDEHRGMSMGIRDQAPNKWTDTS